MPPWVKHNAAWLNGVTIAGVAMATAFGLGWTAAQVSAVTSFVAVVLGVGVHAEAVKTNGK